jgi:hypothetical protein
MGNTWGSVRFQIKNWNLNNQCAPFSIINEEFTEKNQTSSVLIMS